jgi:hypothetical protein
MPLEYPTSSGIGQQGGVSLRHHDAGGALASSRL